MVEEEIYKGMEDVHDETAELETHTDREEEVIYISIEVEEKVRVRVRVRVVEGTCTHMQEVVREMVVVEIYRCKEVVVRD